MPVNLLKYDLSPEFNGSASKTGAYATASNSYTLLNDCYCILGASDGTTNSVTINGTSIPGAAIQAHLPAGTTVKASTTRALSTSGTVSIKMICFPKK